MAAQTIKLTSSDGKEFEMKKSDFAKVTMLNTMLTDLGFTEDALPDEAIPMPTVNGDALDAIIKWLRMHEEEEPKTEDYRQEHHLDRRVSAMDVEFLDSLTPRTRLADVINAAYFLEIPDLIVTLVKFTANSLEGRTVDEMSRWLEFDLKQDIRRAEDDSDEGESSEKRGRTDSDA
uniref:Skp1-related protein n=1 Tax=Steinernema glaseri TaxID=37863 RepID=A0A1I7YW77_9BILA